MAKVFLRSVSLSVLLAAALLLGAIQHPARALAQNAEQGATAERYAGKGVIKAIDKEDHQVQMAHEPIKALDWPAMTMAFKAAPGVNLDAFKPGAKVTFTLSKSQKGYVIEEMQPAE